MGGGFPCLQPDVPNYGFILPWQTFNIPSVDTVQHHFPTQQNLLAQHHLPIIPPHLAPSFCSQHPQQLLGQPLSLGQPQSFSEEIIRQPEGWNALAGTGYGMGMGPRFQPLETSFDPGLAVQFNNFSTPTLTNQLLSEMHCQDSILDAHFTGPLNTFDPHMFSDSANLESDIFNIPELTFSVSSSSPTMAAPSSAASPSVVLTDLPPDRPTSWICEECKKLYKSRVKLRQHMRYHTRRFPCPDEGCELAFGTKQDLDRHRDKTLWPCPVSGCQTPITGRKDNLKRHIRLKH